MTTFSLRISGTGALSAAVPDRHEDKADTEGLTAALKVVGGKWKVLILAALHDSGRRFGELRRLLPSVSEKVLVQQLRELEADGIVHRETYDEMPPRVEYSLTDRGIALGRALGPLGAWGTEHLPGPLGRAG